MRFRALPGGVLAGRPPAAQRMHASCAHAHACFMGMTSVAGFEGGWPLCSRKPVPRSSRWGSLSSFCMRT